MPKKWVDVDFRHNQKARKGRQSGGGFFNNKKRDRENYLEHLRQKQTKK